MSGYGLSSAKENSSFIFSILEKRMSIVDEIELIVFLFDSPTSV